LNFTSIPYAWIGLFSIELYVFNIFEFVSKKSSEFKLVFWNVMVFWFWEFVPQSLDEFGINLHCKLFYFWDAIFKIAIRIASELFNFFVPSIFLIELFRGENHSSGCNLWRLKFQKCSVQKSNFLKILSKEEHFVIVEWDWEASESLKESVGAGCRNFKVQFH